MGLRLAGPFRAVIFDLDGTLLDSAADLACAANQMLSELGLPQRDERLIATFIGKGIARLVERSLAGRVDGTADPGLLARALPIFERHYERESGRQTTIFRRTDVPGLVPMIEYYLRIRKEHPPVRKYNALQKMAYTSVAFLGVGSILSGIAIYWPVQFSYVTFLFGGYNSARVFHFFFTCSFVFFFAGHIFMVIISGWANFVSIITGWKTTIGSEQ